ncbi:MAG TPA: hypothetical protein VI389_02005 [Geobacteraceae bacterium]
MKRISVVTIIVTMMLPGMAAASGTPETINLGDSLSRFEQRLEAVVGKGCSSGSTTMIQAGIRGVTLVDNARVAYGEDLDAPLSRLSPAQAKVVEEISRISAALEAGADEGAAGKMAALDASLAASDATPRVSAVSPAFIATSRKPYSVSLTVSGSFPLATTADARPYVLIKGKKYAAGDASVQKLVFAIPVQELFAAPLNGFGYARVQLMVPYKAGLFARKEGAFSLLVIGIPGGPGKVTLKHRETSPVTETRHIVTRRWSLSAAKKSLEANFCGEEHGGWKIRNETIKFGVDKARGDEGDEWHRTLFTSEPRVCYHVRTIHNRYGESGEVTFHFEYDIERTSDVDTWPEEQVVLHWGESRTFPYAGSGWRVVLDAFDGHHFEYDKTTTDNPLLRVVGGDDFITISAPPAQKVTWP